MEYVDRIMIKFRDVSADDFDSISNLRNDKNNSKYFLSQQKISLKCHKKFIEILNNSSDVYFIVNYNNIDIGTVSLYNVDKKNKICEFGRLLIDKKYRGKGIGNKILNKMLIHAKDNMNLNTIYLHVLKFNKKAINLYKKYNFVIKKDDNNILYMEKKL